MNPLHKTILEEFEKEIQQQHLCPTGPDTHMKSFLLSSLRRQAEEMIGEIPDDTEMRKEGFISLIPGNTNVLKESLRSKYLGKEKE